MKLENLSAYEIVQQSHLKDIESEGILLRHKKTGARIAVVSNEDDNKVFYIGFRTTPEDDTGVPHIIEHTTLCGSEKFPVKDPFVELVKGSLNTFLNAMTYPDKTLYPVASYNDKDFKNLMDVYMDAVFHPNITKYQEIFKQEGWHYELEDVDAPLTINGVVYNEMKGAYSSPDEIQQQAISASLFPDNTYSKDSGGNPDFIPTLTYEAYLEFYHKYYHPSNSYIYLYGDMDVEERLNWLDQEYLSKYDYLEVDSSIKKQEAFSAVKDVITYYPITESESEKDNTYLSYNKVVGEALDEKLYQAFDVLDYVLVSAPGAPVRRALIDAGVGKDISCSYMNGIYQPTFSIIARNANLEDKDKFVSIIEETLRDLVKNGLNEKSLLAGINSEEFRFREGDFGNFPKGLLYGLSCMDSWLYDDSKPFLHLECLDTFAFLKEQISTGYFERLIETYLLNNTHGSIIAVAPKKNLNLENEAKQKEQLEDYKKSLSKEQIEALIAETKHLHEYQMEPSPEEELAKIPMLTREDLKKEAMEFTNIEVQLKDVPVVRHEVATNGIDYMTFLFDANDVAEEDIPYLGLLRAVLGYMNTESYTFSELANEINIYTGDITSGLGLYPDVKELGKIDVRYNVRVKVLEENLEYAMKLVYEILQTTKVSDTKRLGEIIAQLKSRLQNNLSGSGHVISAMRAWSYSSLYGYYQDSTTGIGFYRKIQELDTLMKEEPQKVIDKLNALIDQIFAADRLTISFTSKEEAYRKAAPVVEEFLNKLPKSSPKGQKPQLVLEKKNEAFTDASQIQYVSRTGNFVKHGYSYKGTMKILKMILSYDYLWLNIRVKGGAYGCMSSFLRTGECYFTSYRDPNLAKTNQVYEGVPEYLRNFDPDERDMTKYIIGTFGSLDTPLYPEAKGSRSMAAYLEHLTYEDIQKERDEILNATKEDIRQLAVPIEAVLSDDQICVIGNEQAIRSEEGMFLSVSSLNE